MKTQEHSGRPDTMFLGYFVYTLIAEKRAACASQRTVSGDVDTLFSAKVDNILLWQQRVVLDLVDSRHNGGLRE